MLAYICLICNRFEEGDEERRSLNLCESCEGRERPSTTTASGQEKRNEPSSAEQTGAQPSAPGTGALEISAMAVALGAKWWDGSRFTVDEPAEGGLKLEVE